MNKFNVRYLELKTEAELGLYMKAMDVSEEGIRIMKEKGCFFHILCEGVSDVAANILKQEMLSVGGECVMSRKVLVHKSGYSNLLLMGTRKHFLLLISKISKQQFRLKDLAQEIKDVLAIKSTSAGELICKEYKLPLREKTMVMGILNVTPDSFSDGSLYQQVDQAVAQGLRMQEEGADIIDIGGESTRPGAAEVSAEREIERVLPVLEKLLPVLKIPISIDTYKAKVAKTVLEAGAHLINDVWGLQREPEIANLVFEHQAGIVMMHNQKGTEYADIMGDMIHFLRNSISIAQKAGIGAQQMVIDPGIGFGKTWEQNLFVMQKLEELRSLGCPLLLGTSRKSTIGKILDLPVEERLEGTAATLAVGILKGASIVRVHDVKEMLRVTKMTDAMMGGAKGGQDHIE